MTVIAFIGSVFSPYYAWARRKGAADAENFCAINVAHYGPRRLWAMTERGSSALARGPEHITIGPSRLSWEGDELVISVAEFGMPLPRRIIGEIRVQPEAFATTTYCLNPQGNHLWRPIAPRARVEVRLSAPAMRWSGTGYLDHNRGEAPLADGFSHWTWCRGSTAEGALVAYAGTRRDGTAFEIGVTFDAAGAASAFPPPPLQPLPGTFWRLPRAASADRGTMPHLLQTLEDTPFYARSLVSTRIAGHALAAFHESLSMDRFAHPIVQMMLPFRMPRRA